MALSEDVSDILAAIEQDLAARYMGRILASAQRPSERNSENPPARFPARMETTSESHRRGRRNP